MSETPDIRGLYQKKYIQHPSSSGQPHLFQQFIKTVHPHKFRLVSQKMANLQSRTSVSYVKIVKNPHQEPPRHLSKTTHCSRKQPRQIFLKRNQGVTQSLHLQQKSNTLLRQLMRVSPQQMGELENCAGGERKLKNMFQQFFQKRSKTRQKMRQKPRPSDFVPIHPKSQHFKRKLSQQLGTKRKNRDNLGQSACYDKQLAPWNIPDFDFQ